VRGWSRCLRCRFHVLAICSMLWMRIHGRSWQGCASWPGCSSRDVARWSAVACLDRVWGRDGSEASRLFASDCAVLQPSVVPASGIPRPACLPPVSVRRISCTRLLLRVWVAKQLDQFIVGRSWRKICQGLCPNNQTLPWRLGVSGS
jgi:hypothetical protein